MSTISLASENSVNALETFDLTEAFPMEVMWDGLVPLGVSVPGRVNRFHPNSFTIGPYDFHTVIFAHTAIYVDDSLMINDAPVASIFTRVGVNTPLYTLPAGDTATVRVREEGGAWAFAVGHLGVIPYGCALPPAEPGGGVDYPIPSSWSSSSFSSSSNSSSSSTSSSSSSQSSSSSSSESSSSSSESSSSNSSSSSSSDSDFSSSSSSSSFSSSSSSESSSSFSSSSSSSDSECCHQICLSGVTCDGMDEPVCEADFTYWPGDPEDRTEENEETESVVQEGCLGAPAGPVPQVCVCLGAANSGTNYSYEWSGTDCDGNFQSGSGSFTGSCSGTITLY